MPMRTRIHQALPHQNASGGILLNHHGPEQFLDGDDLAGIKLLGDADACSTRLLTK